MVFQFPSNGKAHVHRVVGAPKHGFQVGGFNSLQTGKHMCTKLDRINEYGEIITVSIPFKRESTCAPSHSKLVTGDLVTVSIPFKRESTCAPFIGNMTEKG